MTPEQYALAQAVIAAAVVRVVTQFGRFVLSPVLSAADWLAFLRLLYPEVKAAREKSSVLARDFYDFQRALVHPELPRLARDVEPYEFGWFVQAMEPVRVAASKPDAPNTVLGQVGALVAREVENAGRRQIIHAVRADKPLDDKLVAQAVVEPLDESLAVREAAAAVVERRVASEPVERRRVSLPEDVKNELLDILASGRPVERPTWAGQTVTDDPLPYEGKTNPQVRGWARVATGRETCAFCLMLISRGPVYYTAGSAGVDPDLPEDEIVDMFRNSSLEEYFGDIKEFMPDEDAWHTNCDCKVVPVFDLENWVGLGASRRAFTLWKDARERAEAALEADPDKMYYSFKGPKYGPDKGKPGWYKTTLNREAMNQLRLLLEESPIDWAALRAA